MRNLGLLFQAGTASINSSLYRLAVIASMRRILSTSVFLSMVLLALPLRAQDDEQLPQDDDQSTLSILQQHLDESNLIYFRHNIRLDFPDDLVFGETEDLYVMQEIPAEDAYRILQDLAVIQRSGMYDCERQSPPARRRWNVATCYFVFRLRLSSEDSSLQQLVLPDTIGRHVTIWGEFTVDVNDYDPPFGRVWSNALPLLAVSRGVWYKIFPQMASSNILNALGSWSSILPLSMIVKQANGVAFDLGACAYQRDCPQDVINRYSTALRQNLAKSPILAIDLHETELPPNEIWMERTYQHSEVLGEPYFENSTYILTIWSQGEGQFPVSAHSSPSPLKFIHFKLVQSLTRAVGANGTYTDPSDRDRALYKTAIGKALDAALQETCKQLHGTVLNSICKLSD